uniref:Uncharacterized protein n=1 Tax=Plectus sambesii TaxID=2011161 RepID=A0A914WQ50_9BILA
MPALLWLDAAFVSQLFENGVCKTIAEARDWICASYPEQAEFTTRTLKRFMQEHHIKVAQHLSQEELESEVRTATEEIGGVPGRKTMQGKGIPSQYTQHRGNYLLPAGVLPSAAHAAEIYRGSNGQLTDESTFGQDPLEGQPEKQNRREQIFQNKIDTKLGGFNYIVSFTVNHSYQPIQ